MNTPLQFIILLLLATVFSGFAQSPAPPGTQTNANPSVAEIAASYTNFQQITKSVVYVNPELAMLCRGASKEEVEAARVRFGPHANTGILVYMNKLAADAFATNASAYPVGSAIVKKKEIHGYTNKDGKQVHEADTGVGGMVKRSAGYDPKHGDWEYFYFEDKKKIESGRISACVECHSSAKDKDYVFGTWRKAGG
ncbi:MAG: cytochrome P460 family protein [Verrucomicrobiota bacterium]